MRCICDIKIHLHVINHLQYQYMYVRGLGFKFVDFLNKSSDVCHTEIKMISSENTFFYLSYKILSVVLIIIVSSQQ